MESSTRASTRYGSLDASRKLLGIMAPIVRFGLLAVGLGLLLERTGALLSDLQLTWGERVVLGISALVYLAGFAIGGWVAGRLLRASAELIDVLIDQAEAGRRTADLLEFRLAPALDRLSASLERSASAAGPAAEEGRSIALAGVHQAIEAGRWAQAEKLAAAFVRDYPRAPEASTLAKEVAEGRRGAIDNLRDRLEAAIQVNDPDQALAFRDELTTHLRGEDLKQLDRRVVSWIMMLIQKRLRTGNARADMAGLAARASESFGDTPEGASLRAALPTLRRSAGLCPRCAGPYTGVADACPKCLGHDQDPAHVQHHWPSIPGQESPP